VNTLPSSTQPRGLHFPMVPLVSLWTTYVLIEPQRWRFVLTSRARAWPRFLMSPYSPTQIPSGVIAMHLTLIIVSRNSPSDAHTISTSTVTKNS
jgi:hypothetical protein